MPEMFGSGNYPALVSSDEIIRLASECRRRLRLRQNNVPRPTLPPFLLDPSYHPILLSYLNRRASFHQNRSTAVSAYVDSLLTLSKIEDSLTPLLPHLLQSYTSLFTSRQIPHDLHSSSSLRRFSTHLDSMPAPDLVPVVVSIISYVPHISEREDAQILILLPKCLNLIDSFERMHNRVEYTNSVLDKMLKYDCCKAFYVKMVEIIHDFEYVDKTRRSEFLGKVFAGMKDVDVQDIPWLVIRLLVLASKGFDKRDVIEGILMFFGGEEMDAKGGLIMRQVEGTVLLHINSVVEKDPGLAREVLRLVMCGYSRAFNHFTIGVLFSISRIEWLNASAIWILKSTLFDVYKGYKFAKCDMSVKESSFGREHVVSSIVKLGFGLLEGVEEKSSKEIKYDCIAGPVELGLEVLKSLFDLHDGVRNEIIQQCILQILSSKPGVIPIIRLLGDLVQSHLHSLLQCASDLKKLLENFTFSDSEISSSLINVLWPLIKCSRDLQDHTILALQKGTFRQEASVHVSAAAAIVELILAEKRSEKRGSASLQKSSSEASSCQKTEVYHITGAGLFQELSGLLRRCLCQQARVREIVYHGLLKLVLIDPLVAEHVLNFILPHFQRFLTKDTELLEIINCIIIENGEVFIEEPFDCLLFCTSWILQLFHQIASNPSDSLDLPGFSLTQENEEGRTLASRSLSNGLLQIRDLIKTESLSGILEDFEAKHTLESGQVAMCYLIFLGIIEVNLNTTFFELEKATDVKKAELVKELSRLVSLYECAEEEASEFMQKTAAKRGLMRSSSNCGSDKLYSSCTNLQERSPRLKTSYIHQLLQGAIKQINGGFQDLLSDDGASVLLVTLSFVLKICMRQLDFISLGKDDPLKTVQGNINSLGSPLLEVILLLKTREKSEISQRKKDITGRKDIGGHRENIQLALVCLKKLITISLSSSDYAVMLNDLLSVARNEAASGNVSDASWDTHDNICDSVEPGRSKEMFIEKITKPLLEEFLGLSYFPEVEVIGDIVQMIAGTMVGGTKNLIGEWATNICRSTSITDPEVAKRMFCLIVSLTSAPNDMLVVQDMATHLLQVVGSEKAAPSDTSEAYPIINKSTSAAIATYILGFIEYFIIEMQYVIRKLQGCILTQNEDPKVLALEESLYKREEAAVLVLSSFVQMDLKYPHTEKFLRVTAMFYKYMSAILKLLSAPRAIDNQILQHMKHQKLEDLTGNLLTDPLCHVIRQKVEWYGLQNYSDPAVTIPEPVQREIACEVELLIRVRDYNNDLIELCTVMSRKFEHFEGFGGDVGNGNNAVLSPKSNSAEAAEDPGSRNGDRIHLPPEKDKNSCSRGRGYGWANRKLKPKSNNSPARYRVLNLHRKSMSEMSSSDHQPPPLSSAEIIQLAHECRGRRQNNIHQPALPPFLLTPSSQATLLAYLNDLAASSPNPSTAVSKYVDSLLSFSKIEDCLTSLLPSLLLSYTSLFTSQQIPHDSHSSSSLKLFSTHLDSMPEPDLVPVVDSIISYLPHISENEDIQILNLLPKCVNLIRSLNGVKNQVEYTNSVLDKMLECGWCKVLCVRMVEIIKDFEFLDKTRRSEFLAKVFIGMRDVDVHEIPWLVNQLLVFASKGFGKREVIEGIVIFFGGEEMDKKDESIMRQAEGNVLAQINFAVEEDPELEKEVLGLFRLGYSRAFNHFRVEVLLSIASVKRLNVSAIGVLKSTLLGAYKGYKFAKECKWLADGLKEDYFQQARAIEQAVSRAVRESSFGREHVVPSIVQLGFVLLECVEKKSSKETKYDCVAGPEELGSAMLKSLFDFNDATKTEIIQQCNLWILSSKPNMMPVIRLLGHLVHSHPNPLLEQASYLEKMLDYFLFLDPEISSSFIIVLWPLMKCSKDLQDNTILVLRKATFRRESSAHISAASAIVELLLAEKRPEKNVSLSLQKISSQASCNQKTEVFRTAEADLFDKLSGLLERCLCHQPRVREIVYHGLLKLVLIDPLSAARVLDFLLPHFQRTLTKDSQLIEIIECIKIESGEFFIKEPFDCLLYCISWILQLFHQHVTDPSVLSDLPGFSLIQENEARTNPASQILSHGLLEIRDLIKTVRLSDQAYLKIL
ncbi:unnamed protein product [Cuscuta campestris]|uniref:Uncharacterized protein n=1 Tax=Cuscuta campestris TaxID=132261 RepID=A0A484MDI9_9ASTE|nr:unnamed protein product [Cuscuta campestris]